MHSIGHTKCIALLREAGANGALKNKRGQTANDVARAYGKAKL